MEWARYIGYNTIPRYLIIDKHGNLKNPDAPRPGAILKDPALMEELVK